MTCMEKLLSAVERENKGDGATSERWRTVLLTSIADSLAVIADKLTGDLIRKDKVIDILDYWYDKDSDGYVQACKSISELQ